MAESIAILKETAKNRNLVLPAPGRRLRIASAMAKDDWKISSLKSFNSTLPRHGTGAVL